jgi:hypothetical protein
MGNLTVLPNEGSEGFGGIGDGEGSEGPLFVDTSRGHVSVIVRKRRVVEFQTGGILKGSQRGGGLYHQKDSKDFQVG